MSRHHDRTFSNTLLALAVFDTLKNPPRDGLILDIGNAVLVGVVWLLTTAAALVGAICWSLVGYAIATRSGNGLVLVVALIGWAAWWPLWRMFRGARAADRESRLRAAGPHADALTA